LDVSVVTAEQPEILRPLGILWSCIWTCTSDDGDCGKLPATPEPLNWLASLNWSAKFSSILIAKLPLTATPAEFRTAAPPCTVVLTVDGTDVGTVGSFKPGPMVEITVTEEAVGEMLTPPVEDRLATRGVVLPLTLANTPIISKLLVVAAVNTTPRVGDAAELVLEVGLEPKPTINWPAEFCTAARPTFAAEKSPVWLTSRIAAVALGWVVLLVMGTPKDMVNTATPGSLVVPVRPVLVQVTRIVPPPATPLAGDTPVDADPTAIGSVWPVEGESVVEPNGALIPHETFVTCPNAMPPMVNRMPKTTKGTKTRLDIIFSPCETGFFVMN